MSELTREALRERRQIKEAEELDRKLRAYKDTGRVPEDGDFAELLDHMVGVPARTMVDHAVDPGVEARDAFDYGPWFEALAQKLGKSIQNDPRSAPTGVDIASKVTDDPYAGTALATAIDVGAQLPIPVSPGVAGVIKKLDGPLHHGSFKEFPAKNIKASTGGFVGPGVYLADDAKVAGRYGDNIHAYNPKEVSILDLMANDDDARLAARQLGVEDEYLKRIGSKFAGIPQQTGRFYALQDAFLKKHDPNFTLIGEERPQALIDALKEKGYTGFKYQHQDAPAFSIWDANNLSPVDNSVESVDNKAMSQAIIDRIKTPEQAVALKGAEREQYLSALDKVYGDRAKRATKDYGMGNPEDKADWRYHGTAKDFDRFDNEKWGSHTGPGTSKDRHWFSTDPKVAEQFADSSAKLAHFTKYNNREDKILRAQAGVYNKLKSSLEGAGSDLNIDKLLRANTGKDIEVFVKMGELTQDQASMIKEIKDFDDLVKYNNAEKYWKANNSSGQIMPVVLREKRIKSKDMQGKIWRDSATEIPEGEIKLKNFYEDAGLESATPMATSIGITNPAKIRSVNAAFDPRFKDSDLLLAGQSGPMTDNQALISAVRQKREKRKDR